MAIATPRPPPPSLNYDCSISLCSVNCPQYCGPPPPPLFLNPNDGHSSSSSHISPPMAALIAVLAAAFLLLFYFTVISKLCRRLRNPHNADRNDSLAPDPTPPTTRRQITECAVCLTEFNENDSLRLLPNCEHAFHSPCIDTWLQTHSNCPLCRSTI